MVQFFIASSNNAILTCIVLVTMIICSNNCKYSGKRMQILSLQIVWMALYCWLAVYIQRRLWNWFITFGTQSVDPMVHSAILLITSYVSLQEEEEKVSQEEMAKVTLQHAEELRKLQDQYESVDCMNYALAWPNVHIWYRKGWCAIVFVSLRTLCWEEKL